MKPLKRISECRAVIVGVFRLFYTRTTKTTIYLVRNRFKPSPGAMLLLHILCVCACLYVLWFDVSINVIFTLQRM